MYAVGQFHKIKIPSLDFVQFYAITLQRNWGTTDEFAKLLFHLVLYNGLWCLKILKYFIVDETLFSQNCIVGSVF